MKKFKKLISMVMLAALALCMLTACKKDKEPSLNEELAEKCYLDKDRIVTNGTYHAEIDIEGYGVIKLELYADIAPITVSNFIYLAKSGFYDGLTFHRIVAGFMMQGGDPQGTGYGGSENNIPGEFAANGWENNLSHTRGTISMARSSNGYDTASSQFFIMHADYVGLDGGYAAFGKVTEGMEIVDKICEEAQPVDDNGTIPAENQPKINSIKITDFEYPSK